MLLGGIFWIIDGALFFVIVVVMQMFTNMLYMLKDEWHPHSSRVNKHRKPLIRHKKKPVPNVEEIMKEQLPQVK